MRAPILSLVSLSLLVSCGAKDEVLLETCEAVGAYDEGVASADLVAAVDALDALSGGWTVTDGCTGQTADVDVGARAEGDVQTVEASADCEALALASADVVLTHPDYGTLTFAMSGTLNDPGAWNTVDLSGTAAEDSSVRLSLNADGGGGIIATLLIGDGNDDASCELQDWVAG